MLNKLFFTTATWATIGLLGGVFYREFTKFNDFTGPIHLSVLHAHALTLGAFFFLIALGLENAFSISSHVKKPARYFVVWNVGLGLEIRCTDT